MPADRGQRESIVRTVHAASRAGARGITQAQIDEAVDSARQAGSVLQRVGKYETPQLVSMGSNGVTVRIETAGRNAGKAITVFRSGQP